MLFGGIIERDTYEMPRLEDSGCDGRTIVHGRHRNISFVITGEVPVARLRIFPDKFDTYDGVLRIPLKNEVGNTAYLKRIPSCRRFGFETELVRAYSVKRIGPRRISSIVHDARAFIDGIMSDYDRQTERLKKEDGAV